MKMVVEDGKAMVALNSEQEVSVVRWALKQLAQDYKHLLIAFDGDDTVYRCISDLRDTAERVRGYKHHHYKTEGNANEN